MGGLVSHPGGWRPPAPQPRVSPLGPIALIGALWKNPLEAWTHAHFEQPMVTANLAMGQATVVSAPVAVRRVLLDNAANYQKDTLQRRMMSAALSNGLLMAEGEQWGAVRDVAADVTLLTLDVLERTIFSEGLGGDPPEVRAAMRRYFDIIGRIEPFDLLGLPDFVPRLGRIKARPALQFFDRAVDTIIATRRRRLAEDPANVPDDILTLLLKAQDPETGQPMSEAEVRANIITFIAAGHETTANTITWSLFLLSQSSHWQERVVAEAEREIGGSVEGLAERLVETRAVIEEAVRLYPPLAAISRAAIGADELLGCAVKPGSMVVIAPYVLHRHRLLWERPDEFDPNRFLGPARDRIDRFAYLPFG